MHPAAATAVRAAAGLGAGDAGEELFGGFDGGGLRFGGFERGARGGQSNAFAPWGEQAVVADAFESGGQHVLQEAADELLGGQPNGALAAVVVVTHAQPHRAVIAAEDAFVGDRHPVGVARQIVEHLGRATGRRLGVDHPVVGQQLAPPRLPRAGLGVRIVGDLAVLATLVEGGEDLGAEQFRSGLHWKQEAVATRRLAPLPLGVESAAGDECMHVQVGAKVLGPGVQHQAEGRHRAEPARIGREFAEGRRGTIEQGVVEPARMAAGERVQGMGQREHPVGVRDRQHFGEARRTPRLLGPSLALRAVSVAAGTVAVALRATGFAALDDATQCAGAAIKNRSPRPRLGR